MSFITFRRYYLDQVLTSIEFYGRILDVGGKKDNKRGVFRPPLGDVEEWKYLNIDKSTNPDYLCSAEDIPVIDSTFDIVLLVEVLEHLESPEQVLGECHRILKNGGKLIVTIPFLYPIHADPYDFQRWTNVKIKSVLENSGFNNIEIKAMGGLFGVIYDLLYSSLTIASKKPNSFGNRIVRRFLLKPFSTLFLFFDKKYDYKSKHITTGYYIEAKSKKVYILGTDKIGWSIDKDRMYTIKAINELDNYEVTDSFFYADIIYAVWWNQLLSWKIRLLNLFLKKRVVACITNDLSHQMGQLNKILDVVDTFVYSNTKQKDILINHDINESKLHFNPFYVDEKIFKKLDLTKNYICKKFRINFEKIDNKILIGSFQRDSLGSDLTKAKWQKDPDTIVEILKKLDHEKYVLVLAGPRRHYVINKCKEHGINYIFIGDESYIDNNKDDLLVNAIDIEEMPYLYNLIDVYLVSSKSEGGPKAIPESVLCETNILSTDVGFAKDLLNDESIYNDVDDAVVKIDALESNKTKTDDSEVKNYYTFSFFKSRILNILEDKN